MSKYRSNKELILELIEILNTKIYITNGKLYIGGKLITTENATERIRQIAHERGLYLLKD